jgi:thioredoxin reductase (NADPH)
MASNDATPITSENVYDAVIIGGGPAGLTAAIYLGRARFRTLVVEKDRFGGQITITSDVMNYPGVLAATGEGLADTMRQQAENFGAEFKMAEVTGLEMDGAIKTVHTGKGDIRCLSVLLCTGAEPRHIGFDGEEEFQGRGISYCATCDGALFADKEVLVIGGGYQAAEESVFLTKYAKKVTVIMRGDDFSCAAAVAKEAWSNPKIEVWNNTVMKRVTGDIVLRAAVVEDTITKGRETWRPENPDETFGVFVFAGRVPTTALVKDLATCDENGYVITDEQNATTCPGLFAAGDVCRKNLRQVATAIGEAAAAATSMTHYIREMQTETGIVPVAQPMNLPKSPVSAKASAARSVAEQKAQAGTLFDDEMREQLASAAARMRQPLLLRLHLDDRPISREMRAYMEEIAKLTDMVSVEIADVPDVLNAAEDGLEIAEMARDESATDPSNDALPKTEVCLADGTWTTVNYHGAPVAHEFDAFLELLVNASGNFESVDADDMKAIGHIGKPLDLKVIFGRSCPTCPPVVLTAERAALLNDNVVTNIYDVAHFPALQAKYNIMSMPALVVNDGEIVTFGRKSPAQVLELLKPYMN